MTFTRTLTLTSAIALFAGPVLADLTAEQVLADQLRQISDAGLSVTVTEQSKSGNTLSVGTVTGTAEVDGADISFSMGGFDIVENGDGTVSMNFPVSTPVSFEADVEDNEDFAAEFRMILADSVIAASGDPANIRYDMSASAIQLSDFVVTAPDDAMDEVNMDVVMTISGLAGVMQLSGAEAVRDYSSNFKMDALVAAVTAAPTDDEGSVSINVSLTDVTSESSGKVAPQTLMDSLATIVQKGTTQNGSFSHGPGSLSVAGDTPDGQFNLAVQMLGGLTSFNIDESGLAYDSKTNGISGNFSGTMMPLPPLGFQMGEWHNSLKMPAIPSEDEQEFGLRLAMADLRLDDMIWGMFDPAGQLPRDLINLTIDLDGTGILMADMFDPAVMEEMMAPPGQVNSANLNELQFNIAGAELTGDGAFTFNNDFGIPMPAGAINLKLVGANTLMDTLVAMGLVPEQQVMGARMMMGMFARPEGEDTLVSTIEMKEDGSILANGQRIK